MRLVTYESNGKWQAGIVIKDKVVDSVAAAKAVNIIADVKPTMRIFSDQTFGPVVPIVVVNDAEEALAVANNSKYGLSAGIITNDFTHALDMAMRLETGMVHIGDQTVNDEPQVPFGGVKGSGYGRFGGQAALDEFTELRWISV